MSSGGYRDQSNETSFGRWVIKPSTKKEGRGLILSDLGSKLGRLVEHIKRKKTL